MAQPQQQLDSDPFSYHLHSNSNSGSNSNYSESSRNVTFAIQHGRSEAQPPTTSAAAASFEPLSAPDSPPATSSLSVVRPLAETPEHVRWMYKGDGDKLWKPFTGHDSIQLEVRYQEIKGSLKFPFGIRVAAPSTTEAGAAGDRDASVNNSGPVSGSVSKATIVSELLQYPERRFSLVNKSIFSYSSGGGGGEAHASFGWPRPTMASNKWFNPWTGSGAAGESPQAQNSGAGGDANEETSDTSGAGFGNDTDDLIFNKGLIPQPPPAHIVIVRSGLYEADLSNWRCKSTFWPCDSSTIARGTWFLEASWEPLPMDYAEQLEQEHLEKFAEAPVTSSVFPLSHSLPESPTRSHARGGVGACGGRAVAHRVTFPEYHVDWTSATDVHLYRKRSSSAFMKSVSQKLGFQWGERVSRGYFRPAEPGDRPPEVGHVVFVVHGIGQKMDANRIVRNCSTFRENVDSIQAKYFDGAVDKVAVFLPIEWRTSLRLDGDLVESITPNRIVGLRQLLNTTAMDIMYYASPLYRSEIQSALRNELNRTFRNFLRRRPKFVADGGKFSILAHSLGSIITYDIITCPLLRDPDDCPEGKIERRMNGVGVNVHEETKTLQSPDQHLEFNLEHFFCLGSPLSVFLALRWREPHNPALRRFIIPDALCRRMYNIFDLNDPIAYRLEPLLNRAYVHIPPMAIPNHAAPSVSKYEEMVREIVNGGPRLEPPEYVPWVGGLEIGVGGPDSFGGSSGYGFFEAAAADGDAHLHFQQQRSPPPPVSTSAGAGGDSFFSAIYNYWSQSQKQTPGQPGLGMNEMEVAAAKLDSINFQMKMNSFDEARLDLSGLDGHERGLSTGRDAGDEPDDAGCSLSMNVGSDFAHSCYSSTIGSGSSEHENGAGEVAKLQTVWGTSPPEAPAARSPPATAMPLAPIVHDLDYRLDFVMRESTLPIPTGYLNALTSHTSYWSSPDIGFFVLAHLYNRIPSSERRRPSDSVTSPQ